MFLMDEPLSNLDAKLRVQTRTQIAALQRRLGTTTVYVTHDQVEAMTMGDRVAVLKAGILQQCASPRDLYDTPDNAFVATFIGSPAMNLLSASIVEGGAEVNGHVIPVQRSVLEKATTKSVYIGVRPEDLHLADSGIALTVTLVEELGSDTFVHGTYNDAAGTPINVIARVRGFSAPAVGATTYVSPERIYVFDTAGEQPRLS